MITLAILILCFAILVFLIAVVHVEQGTRLIIERKGEFLRAVKPGFNLTIPFLDQPAGTIELNTKRIALPIDIQIDALSKLHIKVDLRYCVNLDEIQTAFYSLSSPTRHLSDMLIEETTGYVIARNNHNRKTTQEDLNEYVLTQANQYLQSHGHHCKSVKITDYELEVLNQNINIHHTETLNRLLEEPVSNRNNSWLNKCNAVVWQACIASYAPENPYTADGCPYVNVMIPRSMDKLPDNPFTLPDILQETLEKGHGIMFWREGVESPVWSFSYGDLSLMVTNHKLPNPLGVSQNDLEPMGSDKLIPMGSPAEDILSIPQRNMAHQFLTHSGIENPQVMMATKLGGDLSFALVFNAYREDFNTASDYEFFQYQIRWLFPPTTTIYFADKSPDFIEHFEPLMSDALPEAVLEGEYV